MKAEVMTVAEKDDHADVRDNEQTVLRRLWRLYADTILPMEEKSFYRHFHAPPVTAEEFESKPQVLLLGQYSTGKTSMVKWLTGMPSPHFDVRPQPSTDKFMAIVHGPEERLIQGNAAICLPQLPYQGLTTFGASFLGSFQALVMPSSILQNITFVDTPGVLSGNKQRIGRDYDFSQAAAWMAERADLVVLTFDAHKLDISDEFQEVMEVLRPYADRVRCVLNKADQIDATNLVRVYGALLWNVGKVLRTPEVSRVFVSSFWDEEKYRYDDHKVLFDEDKEALLKELNSLPQTSLLRKMNSFVARVRKVRAHLCVVAHIRSQIPWRFKVFGSEKGLHGWLSDNLERLLDETQRMRSLSAGDMPKVDAFREKLESFDGILSLPVWNASDIARLDRVVEVDVPSLINTVSGVTAATTCRAPASPSPKRRGVLGMFGLGGGDEKRRKIQSPTLGGG